MGTWRVFGERFETGDFTGSPRVHQPMTWSRAVELRALRAWFIFFGDPTFSTIALRIYSSLANSPRKLLATSKTLSKASILSQAHGCRECYFEFDPAIQLQASTTYCIAPLIAGYTGSASSHVAFKRAFPHPIYTAKYTDMKKLLIAPFDVCSIHREID